MPTALIKTLQSTHEQAKSFSENIDKWYEIAKNPKALAALDKEYAAAKEIVEKADEIRQMKTDAETIQSENKSRTTWLDNAESDYKNRLQQLKDDEKSAQKKANTQALIVQETERFNKKAKDDAAAVAATLEESQAIRDKLKTKLSDAQTAESDALAAKKSYQEKLKTVTEKLEG